MDHRSLFETDGELTVTCKGDQSKAILTTDGMNYRYEMLEFSDNSGGFSSSIVWLLDLDGRKKMCLDLRSVAGVRLLDDGQISQ